MTNENLNNKLYGLAEKQKRARRKNKLLVEQHPEETEAIANIRGQMMKNRLGENGLRRLNNRIRWEHIAERRK